MRSSTWIEAGARELALRHQAKKCIGGVLPCRVQLNARYRTDHWTGFDVLDSLAARQDKDKVPTMSSPPSMISAWSRAFWRPGRLRLIRKPIREEDLLAAVNSHPNQTFT